MNKIELDSKLIKELYLNEGISGRAISKQLGCSKPLIYKVLRQLRITRTDSEALKLLHKQTPPHIGIKNANWKGGLVRIGGGYMGIYNPDHPRARAGNRTYVRRDILVWEETHQRPLPKGWLVHHLNGIKDDDKPHNLLGMPTKKHWFVLRAKSKYIRELEAENKLLQKALDDSQLIFQISDN